MAGGQHHQNKLQRVEDDDPLRCQANNQFGQCWFKVVPNGEYCPIHGGNKFVNAQEKENIRIYQIAKFRSRIAQFSDHSHLKSLREEIGILRLLVEQRMNSCKDDMDLMLQSGPISDLVTKIEKLVTSCNKADVLLGQMLDKTQIMQLAMEMIETISLYVQDTVILEAISTEMISTIERIKADGN